ncbi:MAG: KH domain-containing protein [Patescibacteria group bacterium]|nr:KH domain-containing protein [Patescibacteria group bacterium]
MKTNTEFLDYILKSLVTSPNDVKITENESLMEISANNSDLGSIIGKEGKTIRALRNLVNLKTAKDGTPRVDLKIVEA